ncbi:hypothetical protein BH11BAC4_BH11BAC4_14390 [soil metagenome]
MPAKAKKIRLIFFIYWVLLLYIVAALVWWFVALNTQNEQMAQFKINDLRKDDIQHDAKYAGIGSEKKRKTAQYVGEGSIFFLLIAAGAAFVYRAVSRELKLSRQQQNFMMAITHELKTPIAVSKLNLETLQLRKLDDAQRERLIQNTLQETNRLNALCNNMLVSSQIEAGGYRITNEEINISELVQNCATDFINRFPKRKFATAVIEGLFITGDIMLIQIAVNNLVDNAIKYSPKEAPITIGVIENGGQVEINVEDEGPGIEEAEKKNVFEKYYRSGNEATRLAKGTGLGLYLTKMIIAAQHGKIAVKDNQPKGSIFTIQLKQVI